MAIERLPNPRLRYATECINCGRTDTHEYCFPLPRFAAPLLVALAVATMALLIVAVSGAGQ